MKHLFSLAFAIIALASCGGNGCSRQFDSSNRADTAIVDTLSKDTTNNVDTAKVDFSIICTD